MSVGERDHLCKQSGVCFSTSFSGGRLEHCFFCLHYLLDYSSIMYKFFVTCDLLYDNTYK